jgi:hypothetical protein
VRSFISTLRPLPLMLTSLPLSIAICRLPRGDLARRPWPRALQWRRPSAPTAKRASIQHEAMRAFPARSRRAGLQRSAIRACHTISSGLARMEPDADSATRRSRTRSSDLWLDDAVNFCVAPDLHRPGEERGPDRLRVPRLRVQRGGARSGRENLPGRGVPQGLHSGHQARTK